MSYPTLSELYSSISSNFKTKFDISSEDDLKRVLTAVAASDAAMLKLIYLALIDIKKNIFIDTADPEDMGGTLDRFCRVKLGRERLKATQGVYRLTVTGVLGGTLPLGTQFKSGANSTNPNQLYTTTEDFELVSGSGTVEIQSVIEGLDYKLSVNDELFIVNPVANIDNLAVVSSVTTEPTAAETYEEYRQLGLKAYRLEPQGGANSDYKLWALDVDGIRDVYPYTTLGDSGAATIYVEALPAYSTDGFGTPPNSMILDLWNPATFTGVFEQSPDITQQIYERGRRQLGLTNITLLPVSPKGITVTITNLKDQSTSVKTALTAAIKSHFYGIRPFIAGVDDPNNVKDTLNKSGLIGAIVSAVAVGNTFDDVSISGAVSSMPHKFINGDIPYLVTIIYA